MTEHVSYHHTPLTCPPSFPPYLYTLRPSRFLPSSIPLFISSIPYSSFSSSCSSLHLLELTSFLLLSFLIPFLPSYPPLHPVPPYPPPIPTPLPHTVTRYTYTKSGKRVEKRVMKNTRPFMSLETKARKCPCHFIFRFDAANAEVAR